MSDTSTRLLKQRTITYDVWERDLRDPYFPPRVYREDVGAYSVAKHWAEGFNATESFRGRYEYFAVQRTTTVKFEEI